MCRTPSDGAAVVTSVSLSTSARRGLAAYQLRPLVWLGGGRRRDRRTALRRLPDLVGYLRDQFELALLGFLADEVPADGHGREPALGGQREPLAPDVAGRLVDAGDEPVGRLDLGELARYQAEHDQLVVGHVGQRLEGARPLVVV